MFFFISGCGARIITTGEGVLNSPNYPAPWNDFQYNCSWIIEGADPSDRVTLHITYLDFPSTQENENCTGV